MLIMFRWFIESKSITVEADNYVFNNWNIIRPTHTSIFSNLRLLPCSPTNSLLLLPTGRPPSQWGHALLDTPSYRWLRRRPRHWFAEGLAQVLHHSDFTGGSADEVGRTRSFLDSTFEWISSLIFVLWWWIVAHNFSFFFLLNLCLWRYSKICKHSFSGAAVTDMISRQGGRIRCPESGKTVGLLSRGHDAWLI